MNANATTHRNDRTTQSKRSSKTSRRASSTSMTIDALEGRRLCSTSLAYDGTLSIAGTQYSDIITVNNNGTNVTVTESIVGVPGSTRTTAFSTSRVHSMTISGYEGNDLLQNNTYFWSYIDAGAGDDTVDGGYYTDYIYGQSGNDILFGRAGNDYIDALGGNNVVNGGDGNDTLYTWDGADNMDGGNGDDFIRSYKGNDTLFGGNGNDSIGGGAGDDRLYGEFGSDVLYGEDGNDRLDGGTGPRLRLLLRRLRLRHVRHPLGLEGLRRRRLAELLPRVGLPVLRLFRLGQGHLGESITRTVG